jgi:hypothetical protein
MSAGTFDLWQQVFTMSMLANRDSQLTGNASMLEGDLAQTLHNALNNAGFQALIGSSWEVAWGPCVYENQDDLIKDNAMYVAHNTASNIYVVAIAATNPISNFDLFQEDWAVNPIKAWPYGTTLPSGTSFPADVAIAPGTSLGVDILLQQMADPTTGQPLAAFLQSVQSTSATLVFTGHSLAGALAPTLACALITQGDLDSSQWAHVYVYPTAGPTPGNAGFVELFATLFPQPTAGTQPWQVWNSLLWNSLDLVPHAWKSTTLNEVANLYGSTAPAGLVVAGILVKASQKAFDQGFMQLPSNGSLPGTLVAPAELPPFQIPPSSPLSSIFSNDPTEAMDITYLTEAYYQHGAAYFSFFQVQDLLTLLQSSATGSAAPAATGTLTAV